MEFTLAAYPPFSLQSILRSHGWVQLAPFSAQHPYQEFAYVNQLKNGRVTAWFVRSVDGGVHVSVESAVSEAEKAEISAKLTRMLDLERDLAPFYLISEQEPKLSYVAERARGRILRSATLFEDTIKTILTTNTAWSGTIRMVQALVDLYGKALPDDPSRHAFPTPAELAAADVEALRQEAKLGYRAPYISELARRVASGDLDLDALETAELPTSPAAQRTAGHQRRRRLCGRQLAHAARPYRLHPHRLLRPQGCLRRIPRRPSGQTGRCRSRLRPLRRMEGDGFLVLGLRR